MSALRTAADTVTHTVTDVVDEVMQRVPDVIHKVPELIDKVPDVMPGHRRKASRLPATSVKAIVLVVVAVVAWKLWTRRQSPDLGASATPEWPAADAPVRAAG